MIGRHVAGLAVVAALLAACLPAPSGSAALPASNADLPGEPVTLTIFGAASLRNVLDRVKATYETATPGTTLTIATDSSATLRTQIEQGAPADVFLSADQKNSQILADAGLTDGPPVDFAGNGLTIIVPADNPAGISGPADLARPGLKVIAAGPDVPISTYAEEVVAKLATFPGFPAEFAQAYQSNVASREQNAKAVVAKIELGEGDAAIVYLTDAHASEAIATIPIPDTADVVAIYSGVVVAASTRRADAHAFLEWLAGPSGSAILADFGFTRP